MSDVAAPAHDSGIGKKRPVISALLIFLKLHSTVIAQSGRQPSGVVKGFHTPRSTLTVTF